MLHSESESVCRASVSYGHFTEFSLRTGLCSNVCVDQWQWLITEPPSCRRPSVCVGVYYAPQSAENELVMCDLRLPRWCLWERRRSGSECTCRCKNVAWVWHSPAQWCTDIVHSLPPSSVAGDSCFPAHSHTNPAVFCYCCANMLKLMNTQVLTCPCTSVTGPIIHCCVETEPCWPY